MPAVVERHDRGRGDLGEVAVARADLVKAGARARRRGGDPHGGEQLVGLERGLVRAAEERARGDRAIAARRAGLELASSATTAAVSSAQGAAYASEPPTVPRWRVAR